MTLTHSRISRASWLLAVLALVVGCAALGSQSSPAQPQVHTLFGTTPIAGTFRDSSVELGVKFTVTQNSSATGVRFFKPVGATGIHKGYLYRGNTKVAEVTFANETPDGWQEALFATPVALAPGTTYTASYLSPGGIHADTDPFKWPVTSGILKATTGVFKFGSGGVVPTGAVAENYGADVIVSTGTETPPPTTTTPAPTTTTAPPTTTDPTTPSTTVPPTTTTPPPAGNCPVPTPHVPDGPDGNGGCWPGPATTGPATQPADVIPPPAVGDARYVIDQPNTILTGKIINNSVLITAPGVIIRNSIVNGAVAMDGAGEVTFEDSEVHGMEWSNGVSKPWQGASIAWNNYTLIRSEVTGSATPLLCEGNCTIIDSYTHDPAVVPQQHSSGFGSNGNGGLPIMLRHNTLWCTSPAQGPNPEDGGCSADVALMADFRPVDNVTIDNNLVPSGEVPYCMSLGLNPGKPYADQTRNVRVTNNVFGRGPNGQCGVYGPVTSYKDEPGSTWDNNRYDDGVLIPKPA